MLCGCLLNRSDNIMVKKNRRQLLVSGVRAGLLALLGFAGAGAVAKRRRLVKEGKCINRSLCCDCKVFDDCRLPAALSAKLNAKG